MSSGTALLAAAVPAALADVFVFGFGFGACDAPIPFVAPGADGARAEGADAPRCACPGVLAGRASCAWSCACWCPW